MSTDQAKRRKENLLPGREVDRNSGNLSMVSTSGSRLLEDL